MFQKILSFFLIISFQGFADAPIGQWSKKLEGRDYPAATLGNADGFVLGIADIDAKNYKVIHINNQGELVWEAPVGASVSRLIAIEGLILAHTNAEDVFAIDAKSGQQRWHFKAGPGQSLSDELSLGKDGKIYYADVGNSKLVELSADTGEVLSSRTHKMTFPYPRVLEDGSTLFSVAGVPGHAPAGDAGVGKLGPQGEELWRFTDFRNPAYVFQLAAAPNDRVIVAEYVSATHEDPKMKRKGYVFSIDEKLEKAWEIEAQAFFSVHEEQNLILLRDANDEGLFAADLTTGKTIWSTPLAQLRSFGIKSGETAIMDSNQGVVKVALLDGTIKALSTHQNKYSRLLTANETSVLVRHYDEKTRQYSLEAFRNE